MPSGTERARSGFCPSLGLCRALDQVTAGGMTTNCVEKTGGNQVEDVKNISAIRRLAAIVVRLPHLRQEPHVTHHLVFDTQLFKIGRQRRKVSPAGLDSQSRI